MNDCNKYSMCQSDTDRESIIYLDKLLQYSVPERTFERWNRGEYTEYPVPSQTNFDKYLFMGWVFLNCDTLSQLIILKAVAKTEVRDFAHIQTVPSLSCL